MDDEPEIARTMRCLLAQRGQLVTKAALLDAVWLETTEAGLGKTALLEAFVTELDTYGALWIGQGQGAEHYGAGEAYLPVLETLGRLCRGPSGQEVVTLLRQQAPTWLVQMPSLVHAADLETLRRRVAGATRDRMLRELAEALDLLTAR